MAQEKEKEPITEEFIALNFSKSELQKIAKDAGFEDGIELETLTQDPSFLKTVRNSYINEGRKAAFGEFSKDAKGLFDAYSIEPTYKPNGKVDLTDFTKKLDSIIDGQLAAAKKHGESSKDIKELEATLEKQKEEQIALVKAQMAAEMEQLKAERDNIKNEYELLKGKQYDNELMDVINNNIPVTDDAQRLPYEMKPAFKKIVLNEIKKNVEVKQDDNGKNLFTKKGAEIPFSFKDGSETVILKTDGSNVSRYIRTILAEEDILIVKNIQPIAPPPAPLSEQKKPLTYKEQIAEKDKEFKEAMKK